MNPDSSEDIVGALRAAVERRDLRALEKALDRMSLTGLLTEQMPEALFDGVLEIIESPAFLETDGVWILLKQLEDEWDSLSSDQRGRLLAVLERIFGLAEEWMTGFTIAVLLGECFGDLPALDALDRLAHSDREMTRALVPAGLRYIAAGADPSLEKRAWTLLRLLERDGSARVRKEVAFALSQLGG